MKLPTLSTRLQACCNFISPGVRVADIGCDHGYLGIHLLLCGKAVSVIAADVNQQPLDSALRNANKYGIADKATYFIGNVRLEIHVFVGFIEIDFLIDHFISTPFQIPRECNFSQIRYA
jgi:tRNA A22 N-methylase